ncbi:MAG: hypothetical protein GY869_20470, partial [Planctomycetes bacterium]|nr:hypothetical protein [Planctomycetota bacterium]
MKFRLVDKILNWQPQQKIQGIKSVSFEEYSLKSAWADEPCLPESLLMESLFQLGNWLIMLSSEFTQMGLLVRYNEIQFYKQLGPGQSAYLEVVVRSYRPDGIVFDGQALVDDQPIASGKGCLALPVELAEYYDPENQRVLFSE